MILPGTMAHHHALFDARKLLKKIAVAPSVRPERSLQQTDDERKDVRHQTDILSRKYEELGRLLALQHLEKNALSSIGRLSLQTKSAISSTRRSKREKKRFPLPGPPRIERTPGSPTRSDSEQQSSYDVYMPQVDSGSLASDEDEMRNNAASPGRCRSESARGKSSRPRRGKINPHISHAESTSTMRRLRRGSPFHEVFRTDDELSRIRQPTCGVIDESRSVSEDEEGKDTETNYNIPGFVVEGEIDITKTVTYQLPNRSLEVTDMLKDSPVCVDEERHARENPQTTKSEKAKKRVTFFEIPAKDNSSHNEGSLPLRDHIRLTSKNSNDTGDVNVPLHIIMENEILMELLESPRPGNYHEGGSTRWREKQITKSKRGRRVKLKNDAHKQRKSKLERPSAPENGGSNTSSPTVPASVDVSPKRSDHKLDASDNPVIKAWLKRKKKVIRQQKRAERKTERKKRLMEEKLIEEKMKKTLESQEKVAAWEQEKKKEIRRRIKQEKQEKKAKKKAERTANRCNEKGDGEIVGRKNNIESSHTGKKKVKIRRSKTSRVRPEDVPSIETERQKKRVTYDEWLESKRESEKTARLTKRETISADPELDSTIPSLAKRRIERPTKTRGKRLNEWRRSHNENDPPTSDLPESDQNFENQFTLPPDGDLSWMNSLGSCNSSPGITSRVSDTRSRTRISTKEKVSDRRETPPGTLSSSLLRVEQEHEGDVPNEVFEKLTKRYAWDGEKVRDERGNGGKTTTVGINKDVSVDKNEGVFLTESTK